MAGAPIKRALLNRIRERGGWSAILDRIAAGETLVSIATSYDASRALLSRLLHGKPDREKLYALARREAAAAHAEAAMKILDDVRADRDEIAKARARAEHRRWMAAAYDREQFGETKAGTTEINIGQLHLSALRTARLEDIAAGKQLPAPSSVVEDAHVELIEEKR